MYKRYLVFSFLILMLIPAFVAAQLVIEIEAGTDQLQLALADYEEGDIIELVTDGGVYLESITDTITIPTVIRAAAGLTTKPVIMKTSHGGAIIRLMNSLTLEGIHFDGTYGDSLTSMAIYIPSLDSGTEDGYDFKMDNCDFTNFWNDAAPGEWGWAVYSSRAHADSVIITNCYFEHVQRENIRFTSVSSEIQPGPANYWYIAHCTFRGPNLYGAGESIYLRAADGLDAGTPDPVCIIENITFFNSQDKTVYLRNLDSAIVRNCINVSTDSGAYYQARIWGTKSVLEYGLGFGARLNSSIASLYEGATIDTTKFLLGIDPMMADTANGDFTLDKDSPAIGWAPGVPALGDKRWWPEGISSVNNNAIAVPGEFSLSQNYPNPFNPTTSITYTIPAAARVKLDIYNSLGQKVVSLVDVEKSAGTHVAKWNGKDQYSRSVSTGIYFYKLQTKDFTFTKKMLLIK